MIYLSEIAQQISGQLIGTDLSITQVGIDSRTIQAGALYVAISGQRFDGHDFISLALKSGAVAIVVSQQQSIEIPQIVVSDTRLALAQMGALWRAKSAVKLIAITGSNGKTTVKEMLAAILGLKAKVLATQGNFNNEIGVPLTLLRLRAEHEYAVIEMGANHVGEIGFNSQYAQADVSVITNVGAAHLEGFGSLTGVAQAKSEIITALPAHGVVVLNQMDAFYPFWAKLAGARKVINFSLENNLDSDVSASEIQMQLHGQQFLTTFMLHTATDIIPVQLKLAGLHNVNNALAAAAAALAIGIPLAQIKQGLEIMQPVTGRLQAYISSVGSVVIDDSYNANPSSLQVALEVLSQCAGEPWVVLGAFGELGADSANLHQQMGANIKQFGVVRLLAVGAVAAETVASFGVGGKFFQTQAELIEFLQAHTQGHETVLIKGSRIQKMENVAAALIKNFRV